MPDTLIDLSDTELHHLSDSRVRLRAILDLTAGQALLLVLAVPTVLAVRLALWVLPSRLALRLCGALGESGCAAAPSTYCSAWEVAWAVQVIAKRVPRATCLTQTLAVLLLLRLFRERAHLCLGVARTEGGEFRAHAWLERDGVALLGGAAASSMVRLPDLPPMRRASSQRA